MKAVEIMKAIEEMENGERIKLLELLAEKHFGGSPSKQEIEKLHYKFWEE
ncbi:hypothetical protein [Niallia sp. FSL W8-1348]